MKPSKSYFLNEKVTLNRVADGDERAFTHFFELKHKLAFNIALKIIKSRARAKAVVQDVLITLWTNRKGLENIENIDAYLNRITRNKCIDELRVMARATSRSIELKDEHSQIGTMDTENYLSAIDTANSIHMALQRLPAQQRKVYELCHETGLKYDEAALELGISSGTVHTHMKQALKNIRQYLGRLSMFFL